MFWIACAAHLSYVCYNSRLVTVTVILSLCMEGFQNTIIIPLIIIHVRCKHQFVSDYWPGVPQDVHAVGLNECV